MLTILIIIKNAIILIIIDIILVIIDHLDGCQVTRVELPQESSPPWCQGRGTTWRRRGLQGGNIDLGYGGKVKGSSSNRLRFCTDCQTDHRYQSSQELYSESRRRGEASETRRVEVSFTSVVFFCFLSDPSPIIGNACH